MDLVLEDSRRLTGPNLVSPGPGAVLDVRVEGGEPGELARAWETRARAMLDALGWSSETTCVRRHPTGVTLVLSAPIDALYAATEVNEWALEAAAADLDGRSAEVDLPAAAGRLGAVVAAEANPALLRLQREADARGVTFLSDDDEASVGMGIGSRTWPVTGLPEPSDVPWDAVYDVPLVLVTGTNGKTTTVRLLADMVRATGRTAGFSSTDGVYVGEVLAEGGDFSGPGGARTVVRDSRVEAAILETARGGMLRRGLGVPRADGAAVTNVGVDHLGEYGVHAVEDVADAKLVVARAVARGGRLVLNAGDPELMRRAGPGGAELVWVAADSRAPRVEEHLAAGGEAVVVAGGLFERRRGADRSAVVAVDQVPVTLGGAAAYNVENVLVALGLAPALGVPDAAAAAALRSFQPTPERLPGRTNMFRLGGAGAILDFVHNPHGMEALVDTVLAMPAGRRLVVLGQAGDRDDESIRALARAAMRMRPDRVVVKELGRYLRGREPGEVPRLIRDEIVRCDPNTEIVDVPGELEAVRSALEWCADGDLLVLPIQVHRSEVAAWLSRLESAGWRPGRPLRIDPPKPDPSHVES